MRRDPLRPPHEALRRIFWWKRNDHLLRLMTRERRKACETRRHLDAESMDYIIAEALGDDVYELIRGIGRLSWH